MISWDNALALEGSRDYGTTVYASDFAPGCDAYEGTGPGGGVRFTGNATDDSGAFVDMSFARLAPGVGNPFPAEVFQNITNQPIFADGSTCDNQIRLFNSTLNTGTYAPVPVVGNILSNIAPLGEQALRNVFGVLVDTPFVEYNGLDCQTLKGYSGTGPGD